jgi:hypothetical protein
VITTYFGIMNLDLFRERDRGCPPKELANITENDRYHFWLLISMCLFLASAQSWAGRLHNVPMAV